MGQYSNKQTIYKGQYRYSTVYQSPYRSPGEPHKRRRRSRRFVALFVLFLALVATLHTLDTHRAEAHELAAKQAQKQAEAAEAERLAKLGTQINQIISNNPTITFSVSAAEINAAHITPIAQYGDNVVFDAASTGKLITATDFLHHVEIGSASLQQNIDGDSAKSLLQAMIVNSDDDAWADLNDFLSHNNLGSYAASIGLTNYDPDENTLTSNDVALLLKGLYQGKLLDHSDTSLLLGYMKAANYRNFMLPAIPSGFTVYHKVGLDDDTVNEAAIITKGNKAIELVVYTDGNGTYDWTTRAQIMQQIASDVLAAYFP